MASTDDMEALYRALSPQGNDEEAQKKEIPTYTGSELAELSANDMITYDMQNEQLMHDQTDALQTSLIFCERIVMAAYQVAEYVPDLSNNQYATFWKEQVSVIAVEILHWKTFFPYLFDQDTMTTEHI
jgi:hypothetical protein